MSIEVLLKENKMKKEKNESQHPVQSITAGCPWNSISWVTLPTVNRNVLNYGEIEAFVFIVSSYVCWRFLSQPKWVQKYFHLNHLNNEVICIDIERYLIHILMQITATFGTLQLLYASNVVTRSPCVFFLSFFFRQSMYPEVCAVFFIICARFFCWYSSFFSVFSVGSVFCL